MYEHAEDWDPPPMPALPRPEVQPNTPNTGMSMTPRTPPALRCRLGMWVPFGKGVRNGKVVQGGRLGVGGKRGDPISNGEDTRTYPSYTK